MSKIELLVTAGSLDEVKTFIEAGADAVTVGNETFGLRLPGSISLTEMEEAVAYAHSKGRKLYAAVNALMHNEVLPDLSDYLTRLGQMGVDAIEYADPAVFMCAKEVAPEVPLHWNAEMIATSFGTVNYWASKGIKRAVLSRELNLDEILEIKENTDIEIEIQVHGASCIFYSKRPLVTSYFQHQGKGGQANGKNRGRGFYLREEKREDITYPILEDRSGTHILSSEDICVIEHLDELIDHQMDSLRIDTLLKSSDYSETVVKAYRTAIDLYTADPNAYFGEVASLMEQIRDVQDPKRPLTTGFFHKELVF